MNGIWPWFCLAFIALYTGSLVYAGYHHDNREIAYSLLGLAAFMVILAQHLIKP